MRLVIIDASPILYRAFFGNSERLTRPSDGKKIGAVFGVTQSLWSLLSTPSLMDGEPSHIVAVIDTRTPNHRHEIDPDYKANRGPPNEELEAQRDLCEQAYAAFGIPFVKVDGWEADDIIATYAKAFVGIGGTVTILSMDKDLMQLICPEITQMAGRKLYNASTVFAKFGVRPDQLVDYLAMVGDPVDNIRGIDGIGEKKAAMFLRAHGTLEAVLADGGDNTRDRALLAYGAYAALRARRLVKLREDAPMPIPIDGLAYSGLQRPAIHAWCLAQEFVNFAEKVAGTGAGN